MGGLKTIPCPWKWVMYHRQQEKRTAFPPFTALFLVSAIINMAGWHQQGKVQVPVLN
jgi:hypothetical protein